MMKKCPFKHCKAEVELHGEDAYHLIVTMPLEGRPHIHGPTDDLEAIKAIIVTIARGYKIDLMTLASEIELIKTARKQRH